MTSRYRRDALSIAHLTGWELRPTSKDQLSASFRERCRSSSPGFLGQFRGFGSHRFSWGCRCVGAVVDGSPVAATSRSRSASFGEYSKSSCLLLGYFCLGSLSLVARQGLCR